MPLFEYPETRETWKTLIFEAKNQSSRWWIKPRTLKVANLKFSPDPLCLKSNLDIYSPISKIIKELNINLVNSWLTSDIYLFVHKLETHSEKCTQITYLSKNIFFTCLQGELDFDMLYSDMKDYAKWGLKAIDRALDKYDMAFSAYTLDYIWLNPTIADLESRGLLIPITKALFTLKKTGISTKLYVY
jgi:hypothetical protein